MILVTGGTGRLGRIVVPLLREHGEVRTLGRGSGDIRCDLTKEEPALDGVEVVVHLAGGAKGDDVAARNLARAAGKANVRHLVHISVIGADRVPLAWMRAQAAAEQAIIDSGVPYTILRAAQFHYLAWDLARTLAKSPVVPVPGMRWQPVDAQDVAERLVELALGAPAGRVPDLAGPKVYGIADLVRDYLRATGKRRLLLPVPLPGKAGRAYRDGDNLSLDADTGKRTWEEFVADQR
ncbi:NAD(P)H-binding protein [Actinomadura sp. NPDC047616]|uniref:SDR family oxidoreductase n=1 Tax=Actinomadura sp. NPDC047616 TaxID=3155914 RepID=UPI0033E28841